jgi:hypothetical protein
MDASYHNKEMNSLEKDIIEEVIEYHSKSTPGLIDQVSNLVVSSRKYTGVGIYVNFDLTKQIELYKPSLKRSQVLSSETLIYLDNLEYPISYELNLTKNGKFQFIEIVSNDGNDWNGEYGSHQKG